MNLKILTLLYSSSFETFGVIFIESMAVGRPVVTTYCRSSDEIINKDVGIVTKNSSEDLFKVFFTRIQIMKNLILKKLGNIVRKNSQKKNYQIS